MTAEPSPADVAASLTPAMRRALWRRQEDMVEPPRATVTGHGMTMRGLRQRGVIAGAMPHALVTEAGRAVIDAARLAPADGDSA